MDSHQFDALVQGLRTTADRRTMVGLIVAGAAARIGLVDSEAKKRKRKRKKKKQGPVAACGAGGPCLVFVSSTRHTGNLGGLGGADAICQGLATGAGLPGTFKAWLSDSESSVNSRFVPPPGPFQLVKGKTIAANWADLTDGNLLAPIDVTETGSNIATRTGVYAGVWTGTLPDGNARLEDIEHCANWTSAAGGAFVYGRAGLAVATNAGWSGSGESYATCDNAFRLYCFQQS